MFFRTSVDTRRRILSFQEIGIGVITVTVQSLVILMQCHILSNVESKCGYEKVLMLRITAHCRRGVWFLFWNVGLEVLVQLYGLLVS